jgi:RNA recognition motif-containing protein
VKRAEIQYEPNGRSRGTGVVEFNTAEDAETAIGKLHPFPHFTSSLTVPSAKFTGYQYGGRALGLSYVRYTNVSSNGASGEAMDTDQTGGLTQDQIM